MSRWALFVLGLLAILGAAKAQDEVQVEALEQQEQFDGLEAEMIEAQADEEEAVSHEESEVATNDRADAADLSRFTAAPAVDQEGAMAQLQEVDAELEQADKALQEVLSDAKEQNPTVFRFAQQDASAGIQSEQQRVATQAMLERVSEAARTLVEKAQQLIAVVEHNKQYLADTVVAEYSAKGVDCLNGARDTLQQCQMQTQALNAMSANAGAEQPITEEAAGTSFAAVADSINNPVLNPEEQEPESHLLDEEPTDPRFSEVESESESEEGRKKRKNKNKNQQKQDRKIKLQTKNKKNKDKKNKNKKSLKQKIEELKKKLRDQQKNKRNKNKKNKKPKAASKVLKNKKPKASSKALKNKNKKPKASPKTKSLKNKNKQVKSSQTLSTESAAVAAKSAGPQAGASKAAAKQADTAADAPGPSTKPKTSDFTPSPGNEKPPKDATTLANAGKNGAKQPAAKKGKGKSKKNQVPSKPGALGPIPQPPKTKPLDANNVPLAIRKLDRRSGKTAGELKKLKKRVNKQGKKIDWLAKREFDDHNWWKAQKGSVEQMMKKDGLKVKKQKNFKRPAPLPKPNVAPPQGQVSAAQNGEKLVAKAKKADPFAPPVVPKAKHPLPPPKPDVPPPQGQAQVSKSVQQQLKEGEPVVLPPQPKAKAPQPKAKLNKLQKKLNNPDGFPGSLSESKKNEDGEKKAPGPGSSKAPKSASKITKKGKVVAPKKKKQSKKGKQANKKQALGPKGPSGKPNKKNKKQRKIRRSKRN